MAADSEKKTPCECTGPKPGERTFWCERHQCRKTASWHKLCQTRPEYFAAWEAGTGPGQKPAVKPPPQSKSKSPDDNLLIEASSRLGLAVKAGRYSAALLKWAKAGFPVRTDAEVQEIYSTICRPCKQFKRGTCQRCGCRVSKGGLAILNKIRCATEKCPIGKWTVKNAPPEKPPDLDPTIAVGIVTAPRPGPALLERCVTSLCASGFDYPLIFAEPASGDLESLCGCTSVEVVRRAKKYGEWQNWIYGLRALLDQRPKANAMLMVQDDTLFLPRVREWLQASLWPSPGCGAVQVYTSNGYKKQPLGVSKLTGKQTRYFLAACATIFPRSVAEGVVKYGLTIGWLGLAKKKKDIQEPSDKEGVDTFIGIALRSLSRETWVHNPTLVEHDSKFSALGHGKADLGNRASLDFPGLDVDPFDLFTVPDRRYGIR